MTRKITNSVAGILASIMMTFCSTVSVSAQSAADGIPTPESILGFKVGDDFKLADYNQSMAYFKALDAASDRVELRKVGRTSEGQDWYIALISSPENLANVERYREISLRLANPDGLTEADARALAREGKAIVAIDGGLHATETAHAQHTIQLAYDLVTEKDGDITRAILDEVVLVLWPSLNPDGQNIVVDWYNEHVGTPFETARLPRLYQKYIGHDNNRDGYGINMLESRVAIRTERHWEPQVIYSHHMTSNFPATIWLPPYSEPIYPNVHPLMNRMVNMMGTAAAAALDAKGLPGAEHKGEVYDAWYPGYIDFINFFHNIVIMFSETGLHASPTPRYYTVSDFPKKDQALRPGTLHASLWKGGWWRLRDSVNYMLTTSTSTLDIAAKFREQILMNRYIAARDTIESYRAGPPYAYFIPQKQRDPVAAVEMLRRIAFQNVNVYQLDRAVTFEHQSYPKGTWVIPMDQSAANFVRPLLSVQQYPDIRQYPDGPPDLPYDHAGWTLPYQFDVRTVAAGSPLGDDIRGAMSLVSGQTADWASVDTNEAEADAAPFDSLPGVGFNTSAVAAGIVPPKGRVTGSGSALIVDPAENNAFRALNKAWAQGARVTTANGKFHITGLNRSAQDSLVDALALNARRGAAAGTPISKPRIGLYRSWRPSMDEGWTRWLLEMYEFDFTNLRDADVKSGALRDRYDVILLPDMSAKWIRDGAAPGTVPPRYAGGIGAEGVRALDTFVRDGGTLVAMSTSSLFAIDSLNLPVKNAVGERKRTEFFSSGSILEVITNTDHPVMAGMPERAKITVTNSPVFTVTDGFEGTALAKFADGGSPLLSGYLLGEKYLHGYAAALDVKHGDGNVILMGLRPQWRGQPFGTFRMLFNALIYGGALADTGATDTGFWSAPPEPVEEEKNDEKSKKDKED